MKKFYSSIGSRDKPDNMSHEVVTVRHEQPSSNVIVSIVIDEQGLD